MKIAILHSGDLEKISPGGISQYIEKLIKYNTKNEIIVFGTVDVNSSYKIFKEYIREVDGKKFKFIPLTTNKRYPLSIYYFLKLLKNKKKLKKFDIIYAQRIEYALPFTLSKLRKKVIVSIHGSGAYSKMFWGNIIGSFYLQLEKFILRRISKTIVLLNREEFGVPYYQKRFPKIKNNIIYGKVPIDTNYFKKLKNEIDKDNIAIYFGRLDDNPKRILLIPYIVEEVKKSVEDFKFVIIGDGNDKAKLIKLAQKLKVESHILFKDKMKHGNELTEYINNSKVSLILSKFEGICMSALESIACGVPVISTDVGDIKEYIKSYSNGIIIKNSEENSYLIEEASKAIINIINRDDNFLTDNIFKEYEGNKVIQELENIFNSLLEEKNEI